jgi:hypothetical protein
VTNVYCPECGFQNPEGKYCSRCGASLPEKENKSESTISYSPERVQREADEMSGLADLVQEGTHLVVRSGGDMAGEIFIPIDGETTIGRQSDSDIFLDDITVSRNHALLLHEDDGYYIQDQGSLNGTYVNRVRVEKQKLADGDQLQIGKYKLTFFQR